MRCLSACSRGGISKTEPEPGARGEPESRPQTRKPVLLVVKTGRGGAWDVRNDVSEVFAEPFLFWRVRPLRQPLPAGRNLESGSSGIVL